MEPDGAWRRRGRRVVLGLVFVHGLVLGLAAGMVIGIGAVVGEPDNTQLGEFWAVVLGSLAVGAAAAFVAPRLVMAFTLPMWPWILLGGVVALFREPAFGAASVIWGAGILGVARLCSWRIDVRGGGGVGRPRGPLEMPSAMTGTIRLPDTRGINSAKKGEVGAFLEAAMRRANDLEGGAWDLTLELLSAVARDPEAQTAIAKDVAGFALVGLAVADEEVARGWARPGETDACVDWVIRLQVPCEIPGEWDWERHALLPAVTRRVFLSPGGHVSDRG